MKADRHQPGLVSYLRRVSDDDLEQLVGSQERAAAGLLVRLGWKDGKPLAEIPGSFLTLMQFEASVAAEQHRRRDAIRHAEAELSGHVVLVGYGNQPGTYAGHCLSGGDDPWVGPDQPSIEAAVEDGRRHSPQREPDLWPHLGTTR